MLSRDCIAAFGIFLSSDNTAEAATALAIFSFSLSSLIPRMCAFNNKHKGQATLFTTLCLCLEWFLLDSCLHCSLFRDSLTCHMKQFEIRNHSALIMTPPRFFLPDLKFKPQSLSINPKPAAGLREAPAHPLENAAFVNWAVHY